MSCDLTDYPLFKELSSSDADQVHNSRHLVASVHGQDGGNRLHVVTGFANVGFNAVDDDVLRKGLVRIRVEELVLGKQDRLVASAVNVGLSTFFNLADQANGNTDQLTHAVDCVNVEEVPLTGSGVLHNRGIVLNVGIAVQGAGGFAGVTRFAYQANLLVQVVEVALDSISVARIDEPPPTQTEARFFSGYGWLGRVVLTGPAPMPGVLISLSSGDPHTAAVPSVIGVAGGQSFADFTGPPTRIFTASESPVVDVPITASFAGSIATAILHVVPNPS